MSVHFTGATYDVIINGPGGTRIIETREQIIESCQDGTTHELYVVLDWWIEEKHKQTEG